jgi:hypothetical protein
MNSTNLLVENTALEFWERVGATPGYPCDIGRWLIRSQLPIAIKLMPLLDIEKVNAWAYKHDTSYAFREKNRRLRGCILPGKVSTIFVDASDSLYEQRFTIAHEGGHFLLDYQLPRDKAITTLGENIIEVFDGKRQPTLEERLHGILADVRVSVTPHLMERPEEGLPMGSILDAEDRADRLALELLAPALVLQKEMHSDVAPKKFHARLAFLGERLYTFYGLPRSIAVFYADMLLHQWSEPSFHDWLFRL